MSESLSELDPRVITVWRLSGFLGAGLATAATGILEATVLSARGVELLYQGAITALIGAVSVAFALFWPPLRYRFWLWAVGSDRVVIQKGVIWRSRSLIPRVRVQHVDTRTSPIQRWHGLSSLVIYTAGTRGADAEIPGLATEEAERLREELAQLEELDERT